MPSSMPRINWLEIQGFRAFGKELQRVDFSSQISVLWGPNSQGKTSFAEAIEFLFSGSIVRKELLASAQDEFADSLRNTHLPSAKSVYIAAEVFASQPLCTVYAVIQQIDNPAPRRLVSLL
jgi:recombinational DNA repair ATPase RecF